MAQFEVYRNPNARKAAQPAYFVVLQSDFLDTLTTRLVAPIYDIGTIGTLPPRLSPTVLIEDRSYMVVFPQMAGIPKSALGSRVTSLDQHRDAFTAAIDFLLGGF